MPRFQIDPAKIRNNTVELDPKESHHAISVLRLKMDDAVELMDGKGHSFHGVISDLRAGRVFIQISSGPKTPEGASDKSSNFFQITIAASVIKPERMELLIQKSCELGVASIIPVRSERSIVKLSKERWEGKLRRWRKIAVESCKQCGLPSTPEIHEVADFKSVIAKARAFDKIFIPTLLGVTKSFYESLQKSAAGKILVLIGPEGDFSSKEVELAMSAGAVPVNLGPLILRTETAAMYTLSVISFFYREIYNFKS